MNPTERQSEHKGKLNFHCADVGPKNCDWQVSGNSEEEMMPKIEQHGRERHNMTIDEDTKRKVHSAIRKAA
jgi:predicted small metal-binding protein